LKPLLIFNYGIISFVSIYYIALHLFKKNKNSINVFSILLLIISLAEFLLIIAVNLRPALSGIYLISGSIVLLPAGIFITLLIITILFPARDTRKFIIFILFLFLVFLIDLGSVFYFQKITIKFSSLEIVLNLPAFIQSGVILISALTIFIPLILRLRNTSYIRIRTTIIYYLIGTGMTYILFFAVCFTGFYFYHIPLLKNPILPFPVFLFLIFSHHMFYDLKNNDFQKFYKIMFVYALFFTAFFFPVYFFLSYYSFFFPSEYGSVYIKSGTVFIYLVLSYRIINPYIEKFRTKKIQEFLHAINKTLMPDDDQKKYLNMETFWEYITNDNFQNLKSTMGIQSAYFMLINRKDNIFQFTYGYGPELNVQSLDIDSVIAKFITSQDGVFEKSFFLSDISANKNNPDILKFFNDNNIEVSMAFNNMSNNIIGFLMLGKIVGNKSYTSDHLAALDIFRIKIQNLLITDLILDEVTAEQVAEHDKIVVSTVKQRIIPAELATITGIRISSFNVDNSQYGGDYFDSVKISDDKSIIFIAETSYSGIDSALIGMELFSILHSRTLIFNSPEKVLNTMNQVIKTSRLTNSFARCSCVIISSDGNFSYSNASHNPLLIFEPAAGSFTEFETENIPIGLEMNHRYSFTSGKLKDGHIGILYSDGLLSSCNDAGEAFTLDKLKETIIKFSKDSPAVISRELFDAYKLFTGKKDQLNDVTVIIFKMVKTDNEQH